MQNLPGCVKVVAHLIIFCFQLVALPFALVVASSEAVLCWPVFRAATDVEGDDPPYPRDFRERARIVGPSVRLSVGPAHTGP